MRPVPNTTPRGGHGHERPALLVLPGMTLNGTTMPAFPWESVTVDFSQFVPALPDDVVNMAVYGRQLDRVLDGDPLWRRGRRIVVGHSFGGMLALDWVLAGIRDGIRHAEGLVLVATTAGPMFDAARIRLGSVAGREIRMPLAPLMPIWNRRTVTRTVKRIVSRFGESEGQVDFRALKDPSDLTVDLAGWKNTDWRSMRAYRLAMRGFDHRGDLDRIELPTVVLHGSHDSLFPVSVAEDLASRLPGAKLHIVEGAGHVLPLTHGQHVVDAVAGVLRAAESQWPR
jgi:pimeloyl-ACP methyl ester carboxylesterase